MSNQRSMQDRASAADDSAFGYVNGGEEERKKKVAFFGVAGWLVCLRFTRRFRLFSVVLPLLNLIHPLKSILCRS
jgi:hypothetical protein